MKERYCRTYCELTVKGYDALRRIFDCLSEEEKDIYEADLHEIEDVLVAFNDAKRDAEWIKRRIAKFEETNAPQVLVDNERRRGLEHYVSLDDGAIERADEAERKFDFRTPEERLYDAIFGEGKDE